MKFIKQSAALLMLINTLLFFSCKKDTPGPGNGNTPQDTIPHDTIPEDTTVPLLTKVLFYARMPESGDTIPQCRDSIYYNDKEQISQVVSLGPSGTNTYSFVYNSEGLLGSLAVRNIDAHFFVRYELVYKSNRLDEIIYIDTIGAQTEVTAKLTYNEQGKLLNLTSYVNDAGQNIVFYKTDYIRKATGIVDSVNISSSTSLAQSFRPSGTISPVNQMLQRVDKAYLLVLASRVQHMLFPTSTNNNLFWHQFLNAEDNFFNDGTFNSYSGGVVSKSEKYNTAFTLNADSTLKRYQYYQGPQITTQETLSAQFFYTRK